MATHASLPGPTGPTLYLLDYLQLALVVQYFSADQMTQKADRQLQLADSPFAGSTSGPCSSIAPHFGVLALGCRLAASLQLALVHALRRPEDSGAAHLGDHLALEAGLSRLLAADGGERVTEGVAEGITEGVTEGVTYLLAGDGCECLGLLLVGVRILPRRGCNV